MIQTNKVVFKYYDTNIQGYIGKYLRAVLCDFPGFNQMPKPRHHQMQFQEIIKAFTLGESLIWFIAKKKYQHQYQLIHIHKHAHYMHEKLLSNFGMVAIRANTSPKRSMSSSLCQHIISVDTIKLLESIQGTCRLSLKMGRGDKQKPLMHCIRR